MSGTITSQGIGSGIDVAGIVTKLMTVERLPLSLLDTKEASYQAKLTAFGTLKSAFASVQTAADSLKSPLLFKKLTATSSNTAVLTASANTAASAGTYNLNVSHLAQGESIASTGYASMTDLNATADGQLKIELGSYSGGVFTPDSTKTPVNVVIPQGSSSLNGIRDAINTANAGVTARVVDVGGGSYKLMISSNSTGASTEMRITALDSTGAVSTTTGLEAFNYSPAAMGTYTETQQAQDASFTLNGLPITRPSNTISDAITGVTFSLLGSGATTLTVAKDNSAISSAMTAFVKAYNDAAQQIRTLTKYTQTSATKGTASALTGDSTARSLQTSLAGLLNLSIKTQSSGISSLTDLGVTVQRDGTLAFDSTKLDSALSTDPTAVSQLISGGYGGKTGIAVTMSSVLSGIMSDTSGLFATATDSINRSINSLDDQRTALTRRLAKIQANYEAQFSAMDKSVASWNSTSSYLTQQLAALTSKSS
jgi:flagellar hook-associated protein 2